MTRSEAVLAARAEQDRTGLPQLISMDSSGDWSHRTLDGRPLNINGVDLVADTPAAKERWFAEMDALADDDASEVGWRR